MTSRDQHEANNTKQIEIDIRGDGIRTIHNLDVQE